MKLSLKPRLAEDGFQISFPQDQSSEELYCEEIKNFIRDGKNMMNAMALVWKKDVAKITEFHSCEEYLERMERCQEALQNKTLDDLYQDKTIVGNVLNDDYESKMLTSVTDRMRMICKSDSLQKTIAQAMGMK